MSKIARAIDKMLECVERDLEINRQLYGEIVARLNILREVRSEIDRIETEDMVK